MPSSFYPILTPGDADAHRRLPASSCKPVKNKVPDPVYKIALPHARLPRRREAVHAGRPERQGEARLLPRHHRPLPGVPHADGARRELDFDNALGKGGREFPGPWGMSMSRNITSSKTAGIGAWTDAEIKTAITQGKRKDGTPLKPPMGYEYYAKMTDADLDAVDRLSADVPPKEYGPGVSRPSSGPRWPASRRRRPRFGTIAARCPHLMPTACEPYISGLPTLERAMPRCRHDASAALAARLRRADAAVRARRPGAGARGAAVARGAAHVVRADRQAGDARGRDGLGRQDRGEPQSADGRSVLPALLRAAVRRPARQVSARSAPASSSMPAAWW